MSNDDASLRRKVALAFFVLFLVTLGVGIFALWGWKGSTQDEFTRLTNVGKNYLDTDQAAKAVEVFGQALALHPAHPDALLNLANAELRANQPEQAIPHAQQVIELDHSSAAAYYVLGCAYLRSGKFEPALQALQQAKDLDRTVNAVSFQLGRAYQQASLFEEAKTQFMEVVSFETNHPAAFYSLSQVLVRMGKTQEAAEALATHQKVTAGKAGQLTDPSIYERCQYTQARLPFRLEQPAARGVPVTFAEATTAAFGEGAKNYRGPAGTLDFSHDGRNHLFVTVSDGFRLLINSNGVFLPSARLWTNLPGVHYTRCFVADLNNDKVDDVLMLGDAGSQIFKFNTNGEAADLSAFSRAKSVAAVNGVLVDLDSNKNLDLWAVTPGTNGLRPLRNLGHPYFTEITNSGVPPDLAGVRQVRVEDWNNDDLLDLFITREGRPPLVLTKTRGGPLTATNSPADWPIGSVIALGDLNNDLRADLLVATKDQMVCLFNGLTARSNIPLGDWPVTSLTLVDYDNDGWLDIVATGPGLRIWRNAGQSGFTEMTGKLGLGKLATNGVETVVPADFDNDGDTDLLLTRADQSLQLLRNDGGNANHQLKLRLVGRVSNASGFGIRVEVAAGGLRLARRVSTLPVEVGTGKYAHLDSVTAYWFDFSVNNPDVNVDPRSPLALIEIEAPTGSCPYFYAWDGKRFRFVTDLLGASPAGLRLSDNRLIEADAEEYVWIGPEALFPPRDGHYALQITEELREVLYLDEAKLVVVDHPAGTEVHTTGKLLPGQPFPPHQIVTLHRRQPLLHALNHEGTDVTALLAETDGRMVSPTRLRTPQLRGLAEPHSVTLDFGPLSVERPLVLALTGWLRFGGASVNVAASRDPSLPFPFPKLEVEVLAEGSTGVSPDPSAPGSNEVWRPVDVVVGAPAGKTKTILVDLAGKLPPGSGRLRLSTAFEIHWDRIALCEKRNNSETHITVHAPVSADLHWRGYGQYEERPWYFPLTPIHAAAQPSPPWRITPMGWCTRYGEVKELVAQRDNALALINGGDELTLAFAAGDLPPKPTHLTRDFFLYSVGWDKDADIHCEKGWLVEPIPWHGMEDQFYGKQERPAFPSDVLMKKYNTRWVGPFTLTRRTR